MSSQGSDAIVASDTELVVSRPRLQSPDFAVLLVSDDSVRVRSLPQAIRFAVEEKGGVRLVGAEDA